MEYQNDKISIGKFLRRRETKEWDDLSLVPCNSTKFGAVSGSISIRPHETSGFGGSVISIRAKDAELQEREKWELCNLNSQI